MRQNRIRYMVSQENGMVYSRMGSEIAIPVLDWDGMKPENGFQTKYHLEKFDAVAVASDIYPVIKTRKIPVEIKNYHRRFWGMKELPT
jgi:hypothetical protein